MKKFQYFLLLVLFALPIKSFAQPNFIVESNTSSCDDPPFMVNLNVDNFTNVTSFQFAIEWNADLIELTNPNTINTNALSSGFQIGIDRVNNIGLDTIIFSWFSGAGASGTTIPNSAIVNFIFQPTGQTSNPIPSDISFISIPPTFNTEVVYVSNGTFIVEPGNYTNGEITIFDNVNPTITCPTGPLTFDTGGATTTQITGAAPTANDNCDIDFISYDLSGATTGSGNGDVSNNVNFEIGTTTVTYTVTDFGGNTETCFFDVVVTNNSTPTMMTISMDDNLPINCESNTVSFNIYAELFNNIRGAQFTISWPASELQYIDTSNYAINVGNTAFGTTNVSNGQLVYSWNHSDEISLPDGILFTLEFNVNSPAGSTIPIIFVPGSDEFTNNASTVFPFLPIDPSEYSMVDGSINVFDNVNPTVTCPADVTVNSTNGTDAIVNGIAPVTSDNCGVMDTTYTLTDVATSNNIGNGTGDASGTTFPIGTTTVEYTVTDFDGNQATCNFDVTVQVPGVITVSVDSIQVDCETGTVMIGLPVENFIDVIGIQFTIEWDPTKLEFDSIVVDNFNPDGTPGLGQVANGSFNFSWFDISNPTSFADGDDILVLEFIILDQTIGNDYDFTFANAPVPFEISTATATPDPNAISEPGNIEIVDNTDPVITCPADVTINSNGATSVVVNNIEATATDNCGTPSISYVILGTPPTVGSGDASGNSFLVGTTMVTYTATDEGGNTASCSFNVTVISDQLMIECPMNVNQSTDANVCSATLDLPVTILSDPNNINTISWEITGTSGPVSGTGNISNFAFSLGTSTVVYTVTDNFGGSETCSFDVTITDQEGPTISGIPADTTVECDNIPSAANLTATDQCDGITNVNLINESTVAGPIPGSSIITRTWGTVDAAGNISTANQTITVIDTTAPTITCPADITTSSTTTPVCGANVSWAIPTASDNCDANPQVTSSFTPNDFFPLGTTVVTYYAEDNAGNIDSCKFNVIVNDTENPVFSNCPTDMTIPSGISCDTIVTWTEPTVTDNCDNNVNIVVFPALGTAFMAGTTTVTYTATDASGNISTCSFDVTVVDSDGPVFANCPMDMTVPSGVTCDTIVTWVEPTITDNCDNNVTLDVSPPLGTAFMSGTTTVTYTATDASGNVSSCSFDVTVADTEAPVLTSCPIDTTIIISGNNCSAVVMWDMPTATDNCDVNPTIICNIPSGNTFSVGTTPIICTAMDASGNESTCTFNVIVEDTLAPSVFCPIDVTISTNGDIIDFNSFDFIDEISTTPLGCDSVIVFFNNPTGNDNCGIPTITSTEIESGDTLEIGQHVIQFIATDGSGNTNTVLCETTITVTSFVGLNVTASPDTICTGESTILSANPFTPVPGAIISWSGPNPLRIIPPVSNPLLDNITLEDAGTYIATITDPATNCTSIDSVLLVVSQGPELAFIANTTNCINPDGTDVIPLSVQVTNGVTVDSFIWTNPAGTVFSNDQNTSILGATEGAAGLYCVEVFEADGCSNTICETIQITNIPDAPILVSTCSDYVCVGESCTLTGVSIQVDSMVWTATGNDPGLPIDVNQSEITITPTMNGINVYTYTIFDNGCESSSSLPVIVSSPASVSPDTEIIELNTTKTDFSVIDNDIIPGSLPGIFTINVTSDVSNGMLINHGDGTFDYTPDNGFIGDDQFIYEICLDCDGVEVCRWAIVTLSIETDECLIPTVISPNGDGMNDTWEISCVKNSPDNEVVILNRWGDEVYRAAPYNNDWEGTYNNEDLPDGTYFYIFKTTANDPDPFRGTVNIFR
ncbi:MAG: HYR domain-containing protein [Saprospiraceae bacterium]